MSAIELIRPDVLAVLRGEYLTTIDYQFNKNNITVTMSFEQYVTLWSQARLTTIGKKLDQGKGALDRYLKDRFNRPVCSWKKREDRQLGGTMTVEAARIMRAEDSRRMFQFQAGDTHTEQSKERIGNAKRGKPQTENQIRLRTAARVATMARKRAEKEAAALGGAV